jgi:TonB-linked SusC/RagA family outer membrane protein
MKKLLTMTALLLLSGTVALYAQTKVITGTVTSAVQGEGPIPGATVVVAGTTVGAITDLQGKYTINSVPNDAKILIFTYIGMKKQEIEIGARSVVDCILEADVLGLNEVVVTALGISREKKALGYSVSDIKGDAMAQAKETNIINSLQGKMPGVQITSNSGAIGSSSQMIIRGVRSFGDNSPLWVVDGTPISNSSSTANQWGGTDYGNAASDIDPENIESISILKGANAAALYGSRARNGVVLVTTKKGSQSKGIGATYSNETTFEQLSILPIYQNEYGQGNNGGEAKWKYYTSLPGKVYTGWDYQTWAANRSFKYVDGLGNGRNDGFDESWGPRLDVGLLIDQFQGAAQPWVSHPDNTRSFFVTGLSETNNLTVAGSSDKAKGRFSYTNLTEKGIVPNTDQERNSLNASSTLNLTDKLKVDVNFNYVSTNNDNLPTQGYDAGNIMESIGGWFGRQVDMKLLKDNWETFMSNGHPYNWNSSFHNNPYWNVYRNINSRKRERFYGNAQVSYVVAPWLTLMGRYGIDYYNEFRKSIVYESSYQKPLGTGGSFSEASRSTKEINADFLASFNKKFNDLSLSGTLGANFRQYDYIGMSLSADELTVPNFFHISNVKGTPGTGFYESHFKTNSVFGSLTTSYRDYLYLDMTLRNDWSSTLPKTNWSYLYPSVSLSWLFTEAFQLEKSVLSFGKIRGSYARVGSDTSPYNLMATYEASTPFSGLSQYNYPSTIPPLSLKPEFSNSFEIGTELKFLMNRIGLDFSYYDTKTNNQILSIDISPSSGFGAQTINAGEIESSGFEVALTGEILKRNDGLNWTASLNWSKQISKVNSLYPGVDTYQLNSSWQSLSIEARPGEKFGNIYGIGFQRDDQGRMLLDGGFPIATTDNILLGNIMPDWIASINNEFTYKNFNFSFLFDGRMGGDLFSITKWFGDYTGITEETVKGGIRENGMVFDGIDINTNQPNTVNIDPQDWYGSALWDFVEPGVIDGSFIKLREVVFGYKVPVKIKSIKNINISLVARNLAMLYRSKSNAVRIDPETAYGTGATAYGVEQYQIPASRSIGFKLKFDF